MSGIYRSLSSDWLRSLRSAGHRSWQIRQPAAQSKLRELRQRARSACFVPVIRKTQNNRNFTLSLDQDTLGSRYEKSLSRCLERLFRLVEIVGVEPTTPCLQSRCSSQLSYTPESGCKYATNYWNLQIFVALFCYFIP